MSATSPKTPPKPAKPARAWRLNLRALVLLIVLVVVGVTGLVAARMIQDARSQPKLLIEARALRDQKRDDLALSYVRVYLESHPHDLDALELRAEILARSAYGPEQLREVIKATNAVLNNESNPDGPRARTPARS